MGYRRPTYSGLLERLMTDEEQDAQEKYLAEKTAELNRSERVITESKKTGTAVSTVEGVEVNCPKCGSEMQGQEGRKYGRFGIWYFCMNPKCDTRSIERGHEEKVGGEK